MKREHNVIPQCLHCPIDDAANALIKIRNKIINDGGKPPRVLCVVYGICKAAYLRDDSVYVVPVTALKN